MSKQVQVLIVDDQPRTRQSLKALLATCPSISTVQEAANGAEAIERVEQAQPDLVLMDILMPVMDGLQATRQIKTRWPQVKVVALSIYGDHQADALVADADAFVSKGESPERLLATIAHIISSNQGDHS